VRWASLALALAVGCGDDGGGSTPSGPRGVPDPAQVMPPLCMPSNCWTIEAVSGRGDVTIDGLGADGDTVWAAGTSFQDAVIGGVTLPIANPRRGWLAQISAATPESASVVAVRDLGLTSVTVVGPAVQGVWLVLSPSGAFVDGTIPVVPENATVLVRLDPASGAVLWWAATTRVQRYASDGAGGVWMSAYVQNTDVTIGGVAYPVPTGTGSIVLHLQPDGTVDATLPLGTAEVVDVRPRPNGGWLAIGHRSSANQQVGGRALTGTGGDAFVAALDAAGNALWVRHFERRVPAAFGFTVSELHVFDDGSSMVVARYAGPGPFQLPEGTMYTTGSQDFLHVSRFDADGTMRWWLPYIGSGTLGGILEGPGGMMYVPGPDGVGILHPDGGARGRFFAEEALSVAAVRGGEVIVGSSATSPSGGGRGSIRGLAPPR
jgi:hypothetical protein